MILSLADNIRTFRKQRSLTQEQLAEVLGVTVGAVYKWEAGLSMPEVSLIIELADFFDSSVDTLLGYEMKDNRQTVTAKRLSDYLHNKDHNGLLEAEKALKKYPHSFEIVYKSAILYHVFGLEKHDKNKLHRSIELMEKSRLLLTQNKDPEISEISIYGYIAEAYFALGENDKAVELLKGHNVSGIYNDLIGLALASSCNRPDEAIPILSDALLENIASLVRTVAGYVNVFYKRNDNDSATVILLWIIDVLSGLKVEGKPSFLDKMNSVFFVCLAYAQLKTGDENAARQSLLNGKELADYFDVSPDYCVNAVRFVTLEEPESAHDDLGTTAADGLRKTVHSFEDEGLSTLWKEVCQDEA